MNQGILLVVSMINIGSMSEALRGISVLCMIVALLLGCGDPNLGDPKVREKISAKAIDADSLQNRRVPSGEQLRYAPNQERPYNGWVKSSSELYQFQNGKRHGTYVSWYSNQQNSARGTFLNGQRNGLWTWWYDNGWKALEGTFRNVQSGIYVTEFKKYESGSSTEFAVAGLGHGKWTYWYHSPFSESYKRGRGQGKKWEITIGKDYLEIDYWSERGYRNSTTFLDTVMNFRTRFE